MRVWAGEGLLSRMRKGKAPMLPVHMMLHEDSDEDRGKILHG